MRYSASFLAALVISFFVFLGMSILIATKNTPQSSQFDIPVFTMTKIEEIPKIDKPNKPIIPEKKEVLQPPAAPSIDVSQDQDRPFNPVPIGKAGLENMVLDGLNLAILPNVLTGGDSIGANGDLIQVVGIQPIYPHGAARAGIEGWVKVKFTVDEYGLVSDIKVIDSEPKKVFDQATKRALLKSKFKPLIVDGKAKSQEAIQTIQFNLSK